MLVDKIGRTCVLRDHGYCPGWGLNSRCFLSVISDQFQVPAVCTPLAMPVKVRGWGHLLSRHHQLRLRCLENPILGVLEKETDITSVLGGNYSRIREAEYKPEEDLMPPKSQPSQLALLASFSNSCPRTLRHILWFSHMETPRTDKNLHAR